jgi:uncharacterized membrane protein
MSSNAPRSIDQYLKALGEALANEEPALRQDALSDAEEYLRAEIAQHPDKSEADVLEAIASTYGHPEEVADAYRATEATVRKAMQGTPRPPAETFLGKLFGVYTDFRTYTSLFLALVALPTGILYFTVTVTGLAVSAGTAILIFGIPLFLVFIGLVRILSHAEGRLIEGLIGTRMPRRTPYVLKGIALMERIKIMLGDSRTWTTILYMLLALPIGIFSFVFGIVGIVVPLALMFAPFGVLFGYNDHISIDDVSAYEYMGPAGLVLCSIAGFILLTLALHAVRFLGKMHGNLAKALLVARQAEA